MRRLGGNKHKVYSMDFFPDSSYFVTIGGTSKAIWIWDLQKPDKPKKYQLKKPSPPAEMYVLQDVAVTYRNEIVFPISGDTGTDEGVTDSMAFLAWPSGEFRTIKSERYVGSFRLAKKRSVLVTDTESPKWWNIDSELQWESLDIQLGYSNKMIPNNNMDLFALNRLSQVSLYQVSEKKWTTSHDFRYTVWDVIFSPSGKYLLVNCINRYFQVFETATFTPVGKEIKLEGDFAKPAFTHDDRKLLIPAKGNIHIFDIQTSEELVCYNFEIGNLLAMKISDDGLMYAVSGEKKEIVIADLE